MEAVIINFRQGRHTQKDNHMILVVEGVDKAKVKALIGKEVVWKSPAGKEIKGKIAAAHGNKGAMRAVFEKGMPGQAISQKIQIK